MKVANTLTEALEQLRSLFEGGFDEETALQMVGFRPDTLASDIAQIKWEEWDVAASA